jgi:Spy/CpxP family protein refolding chaperone
MEPGVLVSNEKNKDNLKENTMKNAVVTAFRITVVALSLLIFLFSVAGAQSAPAGQAPMGPHHGGFLKKILSQLDLTPDQQTTIQGILDTQKSTIKPLFATLKADRAALKTAAATVPFNEAAVTAAAQQVANDMVPLIVARLNTKAQIFAVLTPVQQAEFEKLMSVAKHRRGGFGR